MEKKIWFLALWVGVSLAPLTGEEQHPRIVAVDAEISETSAMLETAETDQEKQTFSNKLSLLQQEKAILEKRIELMARESELAVQFRQGSKIRLLDYIHTLEVDAARDEKELRKIREDVREEIAKRVEMEARIEELRGQADVDVEELVKEETRLELLQEQIRAMRLNENQVDLRVRLIQLGQRISTMVEEMPLNPTPTTRGLFKNARLLEARMKQLEDVGILHATLIDQKSLAEASLQLSKAQQAAIDEEVEVLESKLTGINRILQRDVILSRAKAMKRLMGRKIEAEEAQVEAVIASEATLASIEEVLQREITFLRDTHEAYRSRYVRRVMVPVITMSVIFLVYLAVSRLLLPLVYQRDELFNARRLGGYLVGLSALVVLSLYFFDDLQAIATVFGIAGAALVIALQDLLSAIAGWFVIVSSRKVKVGDRVEVDGQRGDIIDIQLMRTTLVEINQWLGVDQPTGRIVVIPNSFIFKSQVVNYSHMHRYLWSNIDVLITFESSMEKSKEVLSTILAEECGPILEEAQRAAGRMELKYGVADTVYEPKMYTTVEDSGINFKLLYIAHYKHVSSTRSRISERIARAFEETEGIEFAYPTLRHIPTPEGGVLPVAMKSD